MAGTENDVARAAWVRRVLGVEIGNSIAPALERWTTSRAEVVGQLRQLEGAIRGMKHPRGDAAIILVRAIIANLTPAPDSKRSVAELRRYLETDDIIDDAEAENGFGIDVRIRAPLLPVLDALDKALVA